MVTAMFVFSAAMVRTGAAEMIGGRLFRGCAHNELLLQIAVLFVAAAFSMFINETTIVLVFMPVVLGVQKSETSRLRVISYLVLLTARRSEVNGR